ncbi:MAG: hypothetical protein INQ03_21715 [Candidatus Heimdallarchaeota archaeon]|nr:hypothetical protein [Candidatus Heimdallarchaeota archaeon]
MVIIEIHFQGESVIQYSESRVNLHFGTNEKESFFEFQLHEPRSILIGLNSLLQQLLPNKIHVVPDRTDYEYWRELEYLRISESLSNTSETRKPADLEDYKTIQNRRDDLLVRIRSQINYLDLAYKRLAKIEERIQLMVYPFTLPLLTIIPDNAMISLFGESTTSIFCFDIKYSGYFHGFFDFSVPFYESIDLITHQEYWLSNTPLPGRKTGSSKKLYPIDDAKILRFHRSQMLLFLSSKNIGKQMSLSPIILFDIITRIHNYPEDKLLTLSFLFSEKYTLICKGEVIQINLPHAPKRRLEINLPASLFLSLENLIPYIDSVIIKTNLLGVTFIVKGDHFFLYHLSIPKTSEFLFDIIYAMQQANNPVDPEESGKFTSSIDESALPRSSIIQNLLLGKLIYHPRTQKLLSHNLYIFPTNSIYIGMLRLKNLLASVVVKKRNAYSCEIEGHTMSIEVDTKIDGKCSCGSRCEFLVVLYAIILEEKGYE